MKTLFNSCCLLLLIFCSINLKAQQFKWVKGGGTNFSLSGLSIRFWESSAFMCTDNNRNVYSINIVGDGTITADSFYSSSATFGANNSLLITSYDCNGNMRWAKLIASGYDLRAFGMKSDNAGHLYIAGSFDHSSTYPLHIGYDTTYAANFYEAVGIIELDTNGHFNWIRFVGNNVIATYSGLNGNCLSLDASNKPHLFCYANNGVVLRPGDTTIRGQYDLVYDASGSLVRTRRLGLDSALYLHQVVFDQATSKMYAIGENYLGGLTADSFFAAAFDTGGSVIWEQFPNYGSAIVSLSLDQSKHLRFCGSSGGFTGHPINFSFNGDTITNTYSITGELSFIMTTDTNGHPEWIKKIEGSTGINDFDFNSIIALPNGKVAAAGTFGGTIISGLDTLTNVYGQSPFLIVLDSSGYTQSFKMMNTNGFYNGSSSIASDIVGNVYVGGYVEDSVWGGTIPAYHSVGGNTDFFVMKYGVDCSCTAMPVSSYTDASSAAGTYTFTYSGTIAGADSIVWHFGDGTRSTSLSPTHTYTAAGTYHACVTVYSFCGDDTHCTDIFIPCLVAPAASFTNTGISLTKHFAYTGTAVSLDSVVWHFGDGTTGIGDTITHRYSVGTYTACVVAYNPCGADSSCLTISVIDCTGIPAASFSDTGSAATHGFTYTGPTAYVDSVVWNFGDGSRNVSGLSVTHRYGTAATFNVCVMVFTRCGYATVCRNITIPCVGPPSNGFSTTGGTATRNFTFTAPTTGLDSLVWHFGDGVQATGATAVHTYTAIGSYNACTYAYNHCGYDSMCHTVVISCLVPPVTSFTSTGTSPVNFTYTGTTAATGLDSVAWYFGDGAHATGNTAAHTYSIANTYTVCVVAYNHCGNDSSCNTITIPCDTPTASFTHSGSGFTYTGTTTSIDSIVWSYGDGNRGTGSTSTHTYAVSGTYHVCVTAYTNCASDSACADIHYTGVGLNGPSIANIEVFPNPATDELTVNGVSDATAYRLLSVAGVAVQQGVLQKGSNSLVVRGYAPGLYTLELTQADGQKNRIKVIKQ